MVTRETLQLLCEVLEAEAGALERLQRFHDLLLTKALPLGFLGPREGERLLERHVLECGALALVLDHPPARVVDVGSGAGLPGVVLACLGYDVVLVEAERRRSSFLEDAAEALALEVDVVNGRAEESARRAGLRESFDWGVARAVAPPPVSLELVLPFVRVGGSAALLVGETVDLDAATRAAQELGGEDATLHLVQVPGRPAPVRAMIVRKSAVTDDRYPRRTGVPARRPLGSEP